MTRTTRRSLLVAGTAGTALALGGVAAFFTPSPTTAAGWFGHRGHHFGHFGGRGGLQGEHDPEHLERHLRRGVAFVLSEVDATDEQVDRVVAILEAAIGDLHGMREQHDAQREAFGEALAGAEVDRDALESLRGEGMRMAEEASQRVVTALADAAEVLTPGQREELRTLHEDFHGRRWLR
jgi:protein CpxP